MSKHQINYTIFSIVTVVYAIGFIMEGWPLIWYVLLFILWAFIVVWGSFRIQSNYHLKALCKVKTKKPLLALTFDDGPSRFTKEVLELLEKYDCKATFFCIGKHIQNHREITKQIFVQGHEIGNHTYYHSNNNGFKRKDELVEEWKKTDALIEEVTGEKVRYFRPPFGVTNPHLMRTVKITGHKVVGWNIRSLDTVTSSEQKIFQRITKKLKPGSIVLMHNTSRKSVNVLEQLLQYMEENKLRSVTITELQKSKK